jgi:putative ABC transport system permease protein
MRSFLRDAAYATRLLRRSPAFAVLAVLVIGLGIGPTTAIFSLFHGVLLRAMPFRDVDRLTVLWSDFSRFGGNPRAFSSYADFFDWRDRSRSFESMAAYANTNRTFTALDQPITPFAHEVTANYFDLLGVQPLRGRTFAAGEDRPGHEEVAIISYRLWRSAFGAAESAVGSLVELDGRPTRLIGVLPPDMRVTNNGITAQPDLWLPNSFEKLRQERVQRALVAFGRLRPGVTAAQAAAEMSAIATQIARENPADTARPMVYLRALREDMTSDFRGTFGLLLAAVGVTLLIACANVANLLLARSAGRGREFALRAALGASRGQMLRQMLAESALLAAAGGALGLLLARLGIAPLLALVPPTAGLPFVDRVEMSGPVVAFGIALTAAATLLFGLAPARHAFAGSLVETLKAAGRSGGVARGAKLGRNLLIVGEVALSLALLMAAGLMIQTSWRLSHVRWGFDPSHILHVRNSLRGEAYASAAARRNHFSAAAAKLAEMNGVEAVSAVSFAPPLVPVAGVRFSRTDRPDAPDSETSALTFAVLPRYFETMRIPVLAGRALGDADTADSARSIMVSQSLARRYFAGAEPVGRSIRLTSGRDAGVWRIVGVAGNVRSAGLDDEPPPTIYLPHAQSPVPVMSFVIRARGAAGALGPEAERRLWSLGRLMNVYNTATMEERIGESNWQSRFTTILLSLFAGLALTLAAAGMYAVISYLAAQRTREIGIRMALGANPRDVLGMVVREGVAVAAIGVAVGAAGAAAMARVLAARVYGVGPLDPLTFSAVAGLLLIVAAAASILPAVRAAGVDPLAALHAD